MKLTLQLQLLPDEAQTVTLKMTVERFNAATNWLAELAHRDQTASKYELQKRYYRELRERFDLPADMTIRVIAQVCEAYKRDKNKRPTFRKHAAVPYSHGKNYGFKGVDRVSLSVVPSGRVIVPFLMGKYQQERFGFAKGQADLVLRKDGKWFLLVTVDLPDGTPVPTTDFIGVDLGIVQIATTSEGQSFSGEQTETVRRRFSKTRKNLQKKGTKSAKRILKRLRSREGRFRRHENHCISKRIVAEAKGTGRGIGLEDLTYIRERTTVRKRQRAKHSGWAFRQLRSFIEYKARLAGVSVLVVDPRNSSRTCSQCGHCDKANRKSQKCFACEHCGFSENADVNAARVLRDRARAVSNPASSVASIRA